MIDVKETLNAAGERMEMAAMYLDAQLTRGVYVLAVLMLSYLTV